MSYLIWVANHHPAERYVARLFGQQKNAVALVHEWMRDKVIGEPQATDYYTAEQLRERGYVGVYRRTLPVVPHLSQ